VEDYIQTVLESLLWKEKNMQSIHEWRPRLLIASVVIMMIILSSFLTSCDSENQGIGPSGVEAGRSSASSSNPANSLSNSSTV